MDPHSVADLWAFLDTLQMRTYPEQMTTNSGNHVILKFEMAWLNGCSIAYWKGKTSENQG